MDAKDQRMVWIDLEMTGLDEKTESIIEIATVITDGELRYPSLQKCQMYENQINRPLQKIQTYTFSAYCKPTVIDRPEE